MKGFGLMFRQGFKKGGHGFPPPTGPEGLLG